jgi:1-acyl-sn-glycerol-3-phosphate acyltransferase
MIMTSFWNRLKNSRAMRALVQNMIGIASYPGMVLMTKLKISGMERLAGLPRRNVLFVSNHQTYYADVIALFHVFLAGKGREKSSIGPPLYLFTHDLNTYYVAAEETMRESWISRLFIFAGALMIKRTWKTGSRSVQRELDPSDTKKITRALNKSWVVTFPQGTTQPHAPGRKGTAYIIKASRPIIVPVVIDGFRNAFKKKGLWPKRIGARLSITIKKPLPIDYGQPADVILDRVMDAIEQTQKYFRRESG